MSVTEILILSAIGAFVWISLMRASVRGNG
jgi:hypothetical protein